MILRLRDVSHTYPIKDRQVEAIRGISLDVAEGEFLSLCGPSGCGKTTLLEVMSGLRRPTEGTVELEGRPVTGPSRDIGIVFQEDSTFPWLTVLENIEFGMQMLGVPRSERRRRAHDMVDLVGLHGFESTYPHQLSGGMRQRVAIARTLASRPKLVVMDEPFGALDEQTRLILGVELLRIVSETEATAILVTHSIQEAALLSDRIAVLTARPGRVKTVIVSPLPKPRNAGVLATHAFAEVSRRVWASLEEDALLGFRHSGAASN